MVWLFASVVLLLVVFHAGFRRVALWIAGLAALLVAIAVAVMWWNDPHRAGPVKDEFADFQAACPEGQQPAKDVRTGRQSCYNPSDPAQVAQHQRECQSSQHIAWDTDQRGIPCP